MDTTEQIHMTLTDITVIVIIVIITPLIITGTMDIQETPIIHGHPLLKDIATRHEVMTTIHGIKVVIQRAIVTLQEVLTRGVKPITLQKVIAARHEAQAHHGHHLHEDK